MTEKTNDNNIKPDNSNDNVIYTSSKDEIGKSIEDYVGRDLASWGFEIEEGISYSPEYDLKDSNLGMLFEVKSDRNALKTDNFFFELYDDYPDKKGNILVTKADVWVYAPLIYDERLKKWIPAYIFYVDIKSLYEYIKKQYQDGKLKIRDKIINKHYKIVTQLYVLLKFEDIVPFIIHPSRLYDFAFNDRFVGRDPKEFMWINNRDIPNTRFSQAI